MGKNRAAETMRYAAKLLFQFRVVVGGDSGKRRLCEERIVVLDSDTAADALAKAKRRGKQGEHRYKNDQGNTVHFEFVGILELISLDPECEQDEVWYDLVERLLPAERRSVLIPPESKLNAVWNERRATGKK
jgi:hypothetical protein